jgi:hypothetical protein
MYTVGPMSIPREDRLINGPLSKVCTVFEEWLANVEVLRVLMAKKRPPFIYTLYSMEDIDAALEMPNGLLAFPLGTGGDGERWAAKHNVEDFLNLYPREYIERISQGDLALIITYDDLLTTGFLLKEDLTPDIYCHPRLSERLSTRRAVDVFFIRSLANYYTRVRVELPPWANFGYLWMECLKGACSRNCTPIPFDRQYLELCTQLAPDSPVLLDHGGGYNESKFNNYIDAVIYIPNYEGSHIMATQLYCLWLSNRIPIVEGRPLFRTLADDLKQHFLTPYYPMEGHLLRDVNCILVDNREHTLPALEAKLKGQYDILPDTEHFILTDEMTKCLTDNADKLLFLRERIYNFGCRIGK